MIKENRINLLKKQIEKLVRGKIFYSPSLNPHKVERSLHVQKLKQSSQSKHKHSVLSIGSPHTREQKNKRKLEINELLWLKATETKEKEMVRKRKMEKRRLKTEAQKRKILKWKQNIQKCVIEIKDGRANIRKQRFCLPKIGEIFKNKENTQQQEQRLCLNNLTSQRHLVLHAQELLRRKSPSNTLSVSLGQ